ncbi:MAG: glycosyltransferase family 4 protein [Chthoniobacterales bacterium]|nr:glycosyltransferase family 4 protein [Chthoniobacterales bacterium]
MKSFFSPSVRHATVAFNMRWRRGPYGGGNQWLGQVAPYLERCGFRTVSKCDDRVDCVLGTHAGLGGGLTFSYDEVRRAKESGARLRCIQRINDNDIRKGTDKMDAHLAECNRAADHTVFVSEWLRDYHAERWFDRSRPHSVIHNGADPSVFHPFAAPVWKPGQPLRLVTHHWSDNPAKGFDVYEAIDAGIADGRLPGLELWIVGRWPERIRWRAARTFPARSGHRLAEILRECHVAVTASRYEPGAMHPVEAMQCGLPLLYTADTGGTVELGKKFGVLLGEDFPAAMDALRSNYSALRRVVLQEAPSGDQMCVAYRRIIQQLVCST